MPSLSSPVVFLELQALGLPLGDQVVAALRGPSLLRPHQGVVQVHQQRRVFLDDRLRYPLRHLHDGRVLPFLPRLLEAGADGLGADDAQLALGLLVSLELPQQRPVGGSAPGRLPCSCQGRASGPGRRVRSSAPGSPEARPAARSWPRRAAPPSCRAACNCWNVCGPPASCRRTHWIAERSSVTNNSSCSTSWASSLRRSYSLTWPGRKYIPSRSGVALQQPGVEGRGGQGDRDATLDVEGDHAVEQQVLLTLGDHLDPGPALLTKTGTCPRWSSTKAPDARLRPGLEGELLLERLCGLVGRDHQVLLHGVQPVDLLRRPLLLVQPSARRPRRSRPPGSPSGWRSRPRSSSYGRPRSSTGPASAPGRTRPGTRAVSPGRRPGSGRLPGPRWPPTTCSSEGAASPPTAGSVGRSSGCRQRADR